MATMIIEGERTKAASGKTYEVRNPATGEVVDVVPAGGPADVDKAAHAAACRAKRVRPAPPAWCAQ